MISPRSMCVMLICAVLVSGCSDVIPDSITPTPTSTPTPIQIPTPTPQEDSSNHTGMMHIPAGEFQMGCKVTDLDDICENAEQPLHTVNLDDYYIDKYEVTNFQYSQCVAAGTCDPPLLNGSASHRSYFEDLAYKDYPVVWVSWHNADDYCTWADKRLPTEGEWEKAARGSVDVRSYPWGDTIPTCSHLNFKEDKGYCEGDTSQVGSYPQGASIYGVMDMAGNVWEWVADWYSVSYYNTYSAEDWPSNPTGPDEGNFKVLRGGSWRIDAAGVRTSFRLRGFPDLGFDNNGFRCAAAP